MVGFASTMHLCAHYDNSSFGWWLDDDAVSDVTAGLPDGHQVTDINSNLLTPEDENSKKVTTTIVDDKQTVSETRSCCEKLASVKVPPPPPTGRRHDRSRFTFHPLDVPLIRCIETDSEPQESLLDSPRERFFKAVTEVNSRLHSLQQDNVQLLSQVDCLKQGFQELETDCDVLIRETKHLHKEIQDLRYMDDLLLLLNGQVDRIALRQWPFAVANSHQQLDNTNLIV